MSAVNSTRLSCKGLLRESVHSRKTFPTLKSLCIKKLIPIRNSIKGLEEKGLSTELIKLIFKGSTHNELISAEKNNSGIINMFGNCGGKEAWDDLWESAMKVKYSDRRHILETKKEDESFRDFYFRKKADSETKYRDSIVKFSNNSKLSDSTANNNIDFQRRRTSLLSLPSLSSELTLPSNSSSSSNATSSSSQVPSLILPSFSPSGSPHQKGVNKPTYRSANVQKSNNPILREYFRLKSSLKSTTKVNSDENSFAKPYFQQRKTMKKSFNAFDN